MRAPRAIRGLTSARLRAAALALVLALPVAAGPARSADDPPSPVRLVVMPVLDLTGSVAPRADLDRRILDRLATSGFDLVPSDELRTWFAERRIRYTGGLGSEQLAALRERSGADAILFATVDQYSGDEIPRVALTARVVDLATQEIVWAATAARTGRDRRGFLGLGAIAEVEGVAEKAIDALLERLDPRTIASRGTTGKASVARRAARPRREYRPQRAFRSEALAFDPAAPLRVAVLPFFNTTERADGGEVAATLFVTELVGRDVLRVVEPGVVRDALLRGRIIQDQGLSLAQGDLVRELLDVDLVVTGRVLTFFEPAGEAVPRAAFSVWVFDTRSREVVWSAYSAHRGSDGVVFFDLGRAWSARALLADMVRSAAHEFTDGQ